MVLCLCFLYHRMLDLIFSVGMINKKKSREWDLGRDKRNNHICCIVPCISPITGTAWRRPAIRSINLFLTRIMNGKCRPQWPRGLSRRSAAARLLRSWVRIPPGAWIFVCCECCVLSGRSLCDELITRPEESYRLCCVVVCDIETSRMGAPYIYMTLVA